MLHHQQQRAIATNNNNSAFHLHAAQSKMTSSPSSSSSSSDPPFFANNITAESHYRAARDAIASTFDEFIGEEGEVGRWGQTAAELDHNIVRQFFKDAKASILNNLDQYVQPVPDEDYSDYVDQYHFVLENKRPLEGEDDDDDKELEENNSNEENNEEENEHDEIDEEEIIDTHAWKDARELRSRVRAKSIRVQQLRERVMNRTSDRINENCLEPHISDMKPKIVMGEEGKDVSTVDESLKALSVLLEDPKWRQFPDHIQSLQDTIDVIQKDSAPDRILSQTEIAITGGRRFGGLATANLENDGDDKEEKYRDPMEEILAQKLLLMQVRETRVNNDILDDDDLDQKSDGEDDNDVVDDTEDAMTTTNMDPVDRLALFGHIFS
jgi:hypothetical protein